MRKLIVSMNLTLDGFLSGRDCGLDWHFQYWSPDMSESLCMQLAAADTILLGRKTYEGMAAYWQAKALAVSCPRDDLAFADLMHRHRKLVASRTLARGSWNNTEILNGDIPDEVRQLKGEGGRDIILYGSRRLLATLMSAELIDEYRLWVHPVATGGGKPMFGSLFRSKAFRLMRTESFSTGVVLFHYQKGIS